MTVKGGKKQENIQRPTASQMCFITGRRQELWQLVQSPSKGSLSHPLEHDGEGDVAKAQPPPLHFVKHPHVLADDLTEAAHAGAMLDTVAALVVPLYLEPVAYNGLPVV